MDISNSVIITPVAPDNLRTNETGRRNDQSNAAREDAASRQNRPNSQARIAAPEELEQRSNEIQFSRVQRIESIESAPLRNQQAVNTYQQTVDAGREYLEGELVGVDLFV